MANPSMRHRLACAMTSGGKLSSLALVTNSTTARVEPFRPSPVTFAAAGEVDLGAPSRGSPRKRSSRTGSNSLQKFFSIHRPERRGDGQNRR